MTFYAFEARQSPAPQGGLWHKSIAIKIKRQKTKLPSRISLFLIQTFITNSSA